jgi:aminoglycoside/choline kinase family phosphotransferase
MDYGAPFAGETDDIRLTRIFEQAALPVARVFHALPDAGALVLEDLGDDTLECALARAASGGRPTRDQLFPAAVRLAVEIATRGTAALVGSDRALGPALDAERFLFEMRFFLEHYVGGFLRLPEVAARIRGEVEALALAAASHPRVLCHRDFHSRNIMVRADGELALVDIQDARWGPDTYDLASLLCDAYVDLGDDEAAELSKLYWRLLPGVTDVAALRERLAVVAAQRMIKALGTFGYQVEVMGRERYRSAIPRTVERLSRILPTRAITAPLGIILREEGLLRVGGSEPIE